MKKLLLKAFVFFLSIGSALSQPELDWISSHNGPSSVIDNVVKMAVDGSGNIIATGYANISGLGDDFVTVKFDGTTGDTIWMKIYSGSSDYEAPSDIAVDASGNIYVTGYSYNANSNQDLVLIKYNSNGDQQWVQTYDGSYAWHDGGEALYVNANGIYVTGYSWSSSLSNMDVLTIKYNSAGVEQWVGIYGGDYEYNDEGYDVVADNSGNVYVTGYSTSTNYKDAITIKYNDSGIEQWVDLYDGSENRDDVGLALVMDNAGDIAITGYTSTTSYLDILTIKYNTAGAPQWTNTYYGSGEDNDQAYAITSDANNNIIVTGYANNTNQGEDIATIKYDQTGGTVWTAIYNGPDNDSDEGNDVSVDNSGNVYVTGEIYSTNYSDIGIIKYDANTGSQLWIGTHNGAYDYYDYSKTVIVDASGNVYALGEMDNDVSDNDFFLVKYNTSGVEQWQTTYDNKGNDDDVAYAVTTDISANVYITGFSWNGGSKDITTIKYNKDGAVQWKKTYNGVAGGNDFGAAIAVDGNGNVFVAGTEGNDLFDADWVVIKYNAAGDQQWVDVYGGTDNNYDEAVAIVIDADNNVYVTGSLYNTTSYYDVTTIKYDNTTGSRTWTSSYDGTGADYDLAWDMVADNAENLCIVGKTWSSGTGYNILTVKYDKNGTKLWDVSYDGNNNEDDEGKKITIDANDNVYVAGFVTNNGANGADMAVIKYTSNGTIAWGAKTYNGTASIEDEATSLAVDNSGDVYVTGYSTNTSTGKDITTIKYSSLNGTQAWAKVYNGSASLNDRSAAISASNSMIYVTGLSIENGGYGDMIILKYNSAGTEQWQKLYNGPASDYDEPFGIKIDDEGAIYLAGASRMVGYSSDMVALKYCDFSSTLITASGPTNICQGTDLTLSAPAGGTYAWNTSEATQSIEITTSGDYSLTLSNSNGCSKNSEIVSVNVKSVPTAIITATGSTIKCPGDSVSLNAAPSGAGYSFLWNNGESSASIEAKISDDYYTVVTYSNSCADTSNTIEVTINEAPDAITLCYVTVDSLSQYVRCIWEKPVTNSIDSFKIYRETTSGYTLRKAIHYSKFSSWLDSTATPNASYARYKISVVDTCNVESALSNYHSTMFLQANLGVGGVINLNWVGYEGTPVSFYRIMRDDEGDGTYTKIDSVPASNLLYTDNNPPSSPNAKYAIEVVWPAICEPSFKTQAASINTTRSNIKDKASIIDNSVANTEPSNVMKIYPNPNNGRFTLKVENSSVLNKEVRVFDMIGSELYRQNISGQQTELDLSDQAKGIYFIKIFDQETQLGVQKIIIQ